MRHKSPIVVRPTLPADFKAVQDLCRIVYPYDDPWEMRHLHSHHEQFPEGQLVAVDSGNNEIVGMAASLIVKWDDYSPTDSYEDFTDEYMFTNHDPEGRTLYAAEVMVHPHRRGRGIGGKLYAGRRDVCRSLGLLRIRAGARLVGYSRYAEQWSAEDYVLGVIRGNIRDATLSFQLRQGFRVFGLAYNYFQHDPDSLGWAALIEWINHRVAEGVHYTGRPAKFLRQKARKPENQQA